MAQQKFKVKVSKKYNPSERVALGVEIIDHIIERSKSGKDKKNRDMPAYSKEYKESFDFKLAGKSKKVNLTLSGEMLNALTVLDNKAGEITIGIPKDDTFNNAKAEGNIKGTYGQKKAIAGKKRDFMGISRSDLKDITGKYPTKKGRENNTDLLKTLLATEASRQIAEQFLDVETIEDDF
jgi:hypothetical protein